MNKERLTIIDTPTPPRPPEHDHKLVQAKDYLLVQAKAYSNKDYSKDETQPVEPIQTWSEYFTDLYNDHLAIVIKTLLCGFIIGIFLAHYQTNVYGAINRIYQVFATFYGLYTFYHIYSYQVKKHYLMNRETSQYLEVLRFNPFFRFIYVYVLMRHIYVTRKGFFILNLVNGGLIAACILPIFKIMPIIDPTVFNLKILPELYMSVNLANLRMTLSGANPILPATLICFGFFSLMMSIKFWIPLTLSEDQDRLYRFMDEVNEGYRVEVNEGIQITDDMRPNHLKVVATSEVESQPRISSLEGDYSKINPNFRINTSTRPIRLHCFKCGETFDVQQIKEALDKQEEEALDKKDVKDE